MSKLKTFKVCCPHCGTQINGKLGQGSYYEFDCPECKAHLFAKTTATGIKVNDLVPKVESVHLEHETL